MIGRGHKAAFYVCWPLLRLPRNLLAGAASVLDMAWNALAAAGWLGAPKADGSDTDAQRKRQRALQAGRELGDVAWLALDETPDLLELAAFFKESTEALAATAKLNLQEQDKATAMLDMAEGFLAALNGHRAAGK